MTTTRTIRARVAAGAAALFVAVFSVLWAHAPATPTTTPARGQAVSRHGGLRTITTRTSGGGITTTVVNSAGQPVSVSQTASDS